MKKNILTLSSILIVIIIIVGVILHFKQINNENKYYDSSVLEKYIFDSLKSKGKIKIGNKEFEDKDIRFKQYFYGEQTEKSYKEVIDTIIFVQEATIRGITIDSERENEIITRVNNYEFSNDFLNGIDYSENVLKDKMKEALLEIELKGALINQINQEIVNNDIKIENKDIIKDVNSLHEYYESIENDSNISNYTNEQVNEILEECGKKIEDITNRYLDTIKNNVKIEVY